MTTTVTGIFPDRSTAEQATSDLVAAGFRREQVAILDASDLAPRRWIALRVLDTRRAMILGAVVGGVGGAIAGLLLGSGGTSMLVAAGLGGALLAAGGSLLGTVVGKSTSSQIQAELENEVAAGRVLVSVTSDEAHSRLLGGILARDGRASVTSTAAWFRAAILGGRTR